MLTLTNIIKDYRLGDMEVHALKGVSLSFRKSEFVAILGQSGCGKTTLLNIIGGLDRYTSGDLSIDGRSTKNFDDGDWDAYRNHSIGFVFQSYQLISHQTVLRNVELALTLSGVGKAERRQRAIAALEQVGLGDQLAKKPAQMSGGQMQRVAIARALVNDPDIVLADEPTGALDTETSVQIMEILKEISRRKLVIMVTHNPDLADAYATRIVRLLDGLVIGDTDPFSGADEDDNPYHLPQRAKSKKPAMSFLTALNLSWTNLLTKKGRTLLTAFAGSIGIIGIALILSLSNGIQNYIDRVQEDALSTYPLTITGETVDMTSLVTTMAERRSGSTQHELDAVYSSTVMSDMVDGMMNMTFRSNDLASFLAFLESEESGAMEHISSIAQDYGVTLRIYAADTEKVTAVNPSPIFDTLMGTFYNTDTLGSLGAMGSAFSSGMDIWQPLLEDKELMATQYDVIAGRWPEKYDEVVLLVDKNNEVNDVYLYSLGIKDQEEMKKLLSSRLEGEDLDAQVESWSYDDILKLEFRMVLPGDFYSYDPVGGVWLDRSSDENYVRTLVAEGTPLYVVGIIRPSENASASAVSGAIGYRRDLAEHYLDMIEESTIVRLQLDDPAKDIFSGLPFDDGSYVPPTREEKAALFKDWAEGISPIEQASIYASIASTPSEEDLQAMAELAMSSMSQEELIAQATAGAANMGLSEDVIRQYLENLSQEELMSYMQEALTEQLRQTYSASAAAGLESFSTAELSAMFQRQLAVMDEDSLAALYDRYMPAEISDSSLDANLKRLGYNDRSQPSVVNIYAATFEDKDAIVEIIRDYNRRMSAEGHEEKVIRYTDYVGLLMSSITTIINAISYVLVAFVSISLIVSSIMIGIITYISVLERIREIGILRAIGASKKDIARVFNAETVIVGFCAGAIGILVTVLLNIPISLIVQHLTGIPYLRSSLPPVAGLILVAISICLTLISGLIPSGVAARKDPVEALRTE
ncbi:MAG: ABC transporter ATP-binding protein/permease [Oscillospiraceae bacterium]|nr:ABC transporter ATP-binding protein/permease [Oscillospiraceae bacterium]